MRHSCVLLSLSVLLIAGVSAAPASGAATVSGGSLKIDGLSDLAKGGKLSLVGFAWDGPAKLFGNAFPAEAVTAKAGDTTFAVASDGPATLCQSLGKLGTRTFDEGRLSFKGGDGPLAALKVGGIQVAGVDCAKSPWTANFQAASLEPAEERTKTKGKAKGKGKSKDKAKGKKATGKAHNG